MLSYDLSTIFTLGFGVSTISSNKGNVIGIDTIGLNLIDSSVYFWLNFNDILDSPENYI